MGLTLSTKPKFDVEEEIRLSSCVKNYIIICTTHTFHIFKTGPKNATTAAACAKATVVGYGKSFKITFAITFKHELSEYLKNSIKIYVLSLIKIS